MSKLVATSLEQLSRMCWAANWARAEQEQATALASRTAATSAEASRQKHQQQRKPRPLVDVRLNLVVGDAVDTCDAICLLSSEGLSAWGKARDGDEVQCGGCNDFCRNILHRSTVVGRVCGSRVDARG